MLHIAKKTEYPHKKAIIAEAMISLALLAVFASPAAKASEITADTVIRLVNEARLSAGAQALKENDTLAKAAKDKADDMIANDYFAHVSPQGKTPWYWMEQEGYDYRHAGENLAIDFKNAEDEQEAWMDSPLHRKNILNPDFSEIGVATVSGIVDGHKTLIAVQMFGTPFSQVAGVNTESGYISNQKTEISQPVNVPSMSKSADWKEHRVALAAWGMAFTAALAITLTETFSIIRRKDDEPVFIMRTVGRHGA